MTISSFYPNDAQAIESLTPASRGLFEEWMADLELEHARHGSPYGAGPLAKVTGLSCWLSDFEDGLTPLAALKEDMSNA